MSWIVTNMKWIMLVSGAPIPMIAGLGKLVFIALVVSHGRRYLSEQAGVAVVIVRAKPWTR